MKFGGVSLKGSHAVNQDSFSVRQVRGGYVMAVADGLGSRKHSQAGSAAVCQEVCGVADEFACNIEDEKIFLSAIHERWVKILTENNLTVDKCNSTALIVIVGAENIWAFRLGDGFICVAADDKIFSLFDDKQDDFCNATECMCEDFDLSKWECLHIEYKKFLGAVAATDGITFEPEEKNLCNIMKDFYAEYSVRDLGEILADLNRWIPTLSGADDKTLAFLLTEADDNGD